MQCVALELLPTLRVAKPTPTLLNAKIEAEEHLRTQSFTTYPIVWLTAFLNSHMGQFEVVHLASA